MYLNIYLITELYLKNLVFFLKNNGDYMNKKLLAILVVILAILIGAAYQFVYVPYQNEQAIKEFNSGLENASAIEMDINKTMNELNNADQSDITQYTKVFNEKYNNEIEPKIDSEINKLNETLKYANGNKTKEDYINYQIQRLQVEKEGTQKTVDYMNKMNSAIEKNNIGEALNLVNDMEKDMNSIVEKLKPIKDDIYNLLKADQSFNESLHNLTLNPEYYGDINVTAVSLY